MEEIDELVSDQEFLERFDLILQDMEVDSEVNAFNIHTGWVLDD